jgi:hypothetical protein
VSGELRLGWAAATPRRGQSRAAATGLVVDFYNGSRQIGPVNARKSPRHRS